MKYASFWRQLFAVVIDQIIVILPSSLLSQAYFYWLVAGGAAQNTANYHSQIFLTVSVLGLFSLYYVFLNGRFGVTLGRRLMNLKLVRLDQPNRDGIGYGKAAVRLLLFAFASGFIRVSVFAGVPAILGIIVDGVAGATILWLLMDNRRRTVEDIVAGTIIVHDPLGKFADFDPDKLPPAKARPYSLAALIILNALASIFIIINR